MRIKAVLRDSDILGLEPGTNERIVTTAIKNVDRVISLSSLMKVMGLRVEEKTKMLHALSNQQIHIVDGLEISYADDKRIFEPS